MGRVCGVWGLFIEYWGVGCGARWEGWLVSVGSWVPGWRPWGRGTRGLRGLGRGGMPAGAGRDLAWPGLDGGAGPREHGAGPRRGLGWAERRGLGRAGRGLTAWGGAWAGGGAGPAGARTQSARPLPAAMLAGVWVSNGARSGGGSAGSRRSRLLNASGGRSRASGSARRSAGELGPRGLGAGAGPGRGPCPFPGGRPQSAAPPAVPQSMHPRSPSRVSTSGGTPSYPPHEVEHGPLPVWIPRSAAGTPPPFPLGELFLSYPRSLGLPLLPPEIREPLQAPPSTFKPRTTPRLLPGALCSPPRARRPFPPGVGGGIPRPGCRPSLSGLPRVSSLPQGPGSPSPPPPHSPAGTGAAEPGSSCLLFRVGWQRPARRFCRPGRVGDWVRGAASSRRPFLSLPVGRLPRSPAPWERPALPRGVRANRFLFATGVGPVSWRGRCSSLPQKPRQGPVETHSSAHGLRLGPFTVLLTCGRI